MNTAISAPPAAAVRFELIGKIVRDHTTNLEWTQGNVVDSRVSWKEATAACEKLELEGGGWRLPTIQELLSLVDYERFDPAIAPVFECRPNYYWTATPYAPSPGDCAWLVYFDAGGADWSDRHGGGFVRAVRARQS
jgi:hypothetical protein